MMKRTAGFVLACCIIFCLLAGCAGGAPQDVTETAAPTVPPTEAPTEPPTEPPTQPPTEAPTEPPTQPPTEAPTEAPTEPAEKVELSETAVVLTQKGQTLEIYCGEAPMENISWLSDDESIAIFSQGTVVAVNKGTTLVHAVMEDQTVSCEVTCDVNPDDPMPKIPAKLRNAPRLAPPVVDMEDTSFFDDAAFIGDSVSHALKQWHAQTGAFGDAQFLVRNAMGLQNSIDGRMKIIYRGKEWDPEDAVQEAGVKKVFIMFGFNDLGLFGIDGTLERWDIFVGRIVEVNPEVEIYIQSCTPIHSKGEYTGYDNEFFDEYNAALEAFCGEKGYHFVNIAPWFKDYTNAMATRYSSDNFVHMNFEGTAVWERVLKAYAAEQTEGA